MKTRIVSADNTVLTDWSVNLTNFYSGDASTTVVAAEDYIYFGSTLPVNSFYISADLTNSNSSQMTIEHYDGTAWQEVAETIDETSLSGKTLGQSGFVTWVTDKNKSWSRVDTPDITALSSLKIYDLYWARMKFSANLTPITLSWLGHIFSDDNHLGSEFPDLVRASVKSAFSASKTDWKEQHYIAAELIKKDLIHKRMMVDENQILDREDLRLASVQKVAQLIYSALGDDYIDQRNDAEKEYYRRLEKSYVKIDLNANARMDLQEQRPNEILNRLVRG